MERLTIVDKTLNIVNIEKTNNKQTKKSGMVGIGGTQKQYSVAQCLREKKKLESQNRGLSAVYKGGG